MLFTLTSASLTIQSLIAFLWPNRGAVDWMPSRVREVREKLAELSGSKNRDQQFKICVMASDEKHASEDSIMIDTVQRSLVIRCKGTEHALSKITNNGMLGRGATDTLEGGSTT